MELKTVLAIVTFTGIAGVTHAHWTPGMAV